MQKEFTNPFQITKAVDFSDDEIYSFWVDFPTEGGFFKLVSPTSPMPMLLLGGKGSGKTHLMRYFSYNLQKLRAKGELYKGIKDEGYLGIYLRCGGLNANRFTRKGQDDAKWNTIFSFYMDLSLAQLLLRTINDLFKDTAELRNNEKDICLSIIELFDDFDSCEINTLSGLIEKIDDIRKSLDVEINNCVITGNLNIKILASPGKLVFGVPEVLSEKIDSLSSILFLYLLDEIENLNEEQQKYINTLVREKEPPASFKIGARLYGVRTTLTYSADEEIKEGSEYEKIVLDSQFRRKSAMKSYKQFAARLCLKRFNKVYRGICDIQEGSDAIKEFGQYFKVQIKTEFMERQTQDIVSKYSPKDRPYIKRLKNQLLESKKQGGINGVNSNDDIDKIINTILIEKYPLIEKLNIFLLYQDWYHKRNLVESAENINESSYRFVNNPSENSEYKQIFNHWKQDLLAQLYRDCDNKLIYSGINALIDMSHGLPRNLLIILKNIYKWSIFNGEIPFTENNFSIKSQMQGIKDAAEWFFQDARPSGEYGWMLRDSVARLAHLFRECRFSDKPTEVSLNSFSTNISKVSSSSQKMIELAEKWSLLIMIPGGQKDRNTKRVDQKYQLNRMLSPRWDLPIARRGVISLTANEVNAIFDPGHTDDFEGVLKDRLSRMKAPFRGRETDQISLFGTTDD